METINGIEQSNLFSASQISDRANLLGTSNQIIVSANGTNVLLGTANVTLSLPQSIGTSSSVQFATLSLGITDSVDLHISKDRDGSVSQIISNANNVAGENRYSTIFIKGDNSAVITEIISGKNSSNTVISEIGTFTNHSFNIKSNNIIGATLDTSQNFVIGASTISAGAKLTIGSNSADLQLKSSGASASNTSIIYFTTTQEYGISDKASIAGSHNGSSAEGKLIFSVRASDSLAQKAYLDANGLHATKYYVDSTAGFNGTVANPTSITITNGIVTACS